MRIVIDLQACQSGSRLGGIGRYSMNLAEAMVRQCGKHELIFVLNNLFPETIPGIYQTLTKTLPKNQIRVFNVPGPVEGANLENRFRTQTAEILREQFIFNLKPDIVHISSLIEGLADNVVTSVGALIPGNTTSVTLYDLIPLVEKEKYLQSVVTQEHYYSKLEDLKRAGSLLAISEFSRREAIEMLGIKPEIITTISSAVDEKFKPMEIAHEEASSVHKKYGITRKFLLFTGSFDQRKNHEGLIRAFARLPRDVRKSYQLLIIGNGWDGIYAHLRTIAQQEGLSKDDLIFAGHVTDHDLLVIYNTTHLFVFPSLSEGFGLPVLEAMSCAIPTIGSNTTSIPEVIGLSDALFDPYDIGSITAKIHQALTNENFREVLKQHALAYSKNFSWDASAKKAMEAFEIQHEQTRHQSSYFFDTLHTLSIESISKISSVEQAGDRDLVEIAASMDANYAAVSTVDSLQKIGWVTTWNTRCGIAMYSKYLGEAHHSDYTILAPYENQTLSPDEINVVRCWQPDKDNLRELSRTIDTLGITTLVIQFNYGFFEFPAFNMFVNEMVAQGRSLYVTLHSTTDNTQKQLVDIAQALALCDGVMVHSRNDLVNLAKIGISDNVILFPQGIVDTQPANIDSPAAPESFVIASYGFFLPHKGFLELLETAKILIDRGVDIHVLMVNAQYPAEISHSLILEAQKKSLEYGINQRVTLITDFLSDEESLGHLANADLIIYPYQETGESSSAAVRMGLASGRPVAVTPLSIFDDVRDVVITLSSEKITDMADSIDRIKRKLEAEEEVLANTAQRAQKWRQDHLYSQLGEDFWKLLTKVKR